MKSKLKIHTNIKRGGLVACALIGLLLWANCWGATYYCSVAGAGAKDGGQETPFDLAALQTAIAADTDSTPYFSGDTVKFATGSYGSWSDTGLEVDGRTDYVTFKAATGETPHFDYISISDLSTHYDVKVKFEGFKITGTGTPNRGVYIRQNDDIWFTDCNFVGTDFTLLDSSYGVYLYNCDHIRLIGCTIGTERPYTDEKGWDNGIYSRNVDEVVVYQCNLFQCSQGIVQWGNHWDINDCTIHDLWRDGIYIVSSEDVYVHDCEIYDLNSLQLMNDSTTGFTYDHDTSTITANSGTPFSVIRHTHDRIRIKVGETWATTTYVSTMPAAIGDGSTCLVDGSFGAEYDEAVVSQVQAWDATHVDCIQIGYTLSGGGGTPLDTEWGSMSDIVLRNNKFYNSCGHLVTANPGLIIQTVTGDDLSYNDTTKIITDDQSEGVFSTLNTYDPDVGMCIRLYGATATYYCEILQVIDNDNILVRDGFGQNEAGVTGFSAAQYLNPTGLVVENNLFHNNGSVIWPSDSSFWVEDMNNVICRGNTTDNDLYFRVRFESTFNVIEGVKVSQLYGNIAREIDFNGHAPSSVSAAGNVAWKALTWSPTDDECYETYEDLGDTDESQFKAMFTNYDTNDFSLTNTSLGLDRVALANMPSTDIDGRVRVDVSGQGNDSSDYADAGCYENQTGVVRYYLLLK